MAKEIDSKKRKASIQNSEVEKMKKPKKAVAEDINVTVKKRKAIEDPAPVAVKKPKTPKAYAAKEREAAEEETEVTEKSPKPSGDSTKKSKKAKLAGQHAEKTKSKKAEEAQRVDDHDEEQENNGNTEGEESEFSEDDHTKALLKGFESEGDEDTDNEEGFEPGQEIPKIPVLNKRQLKKFATADADEKPGVVYIGRIPHGFYEHEMRAYFEQFGKILNLRLSRNRRTGASRHIAWIQFAESSVAEIVSKTMDNYLLMGHLLKVKKLPDEQVPKNLFKGANRRFKTIPWGRLEARRLKLAASESTWDKRIEREKKRRDEKAKKLKEIDYEFEAPEIRPARGVAKKSDEVETLLPTDESNQLETLAIENAKTAAAQETNKPKKTTKKAKASEVVEEAVEEPAVALIPEVTEKAKKKDKKIKAAMVEKDIAPADIANGEKKAKKNKKSKVSA